MIPDTDTPKANRAKQIGNKADVTLELYDTSVNTTANEIGPDETTASDKSKSKKKPVFFSTGKWLHPLFELENYLETACPQKEEREKYFLVDKIIGKAAAHLVIRLGIKKLHAGILSKLGKDALDLFHLEYTFDKLVDRIICRTEKILSDVDNPEESYRIIKKLIEDRRDK